MVEQVKKELFFTEGIADITSYEGYRYENRVACFGMRVGPEKSIRDGLFHEIGHVAEVKNLNRLLCHNFNLEIKSKVEVLGRYYDEPRTWNATKLECRVILWQEVLCNHFGVSFDRNEFATALQYMPDHTCVPVKGYQFDAEVLEYINKNGRILKGLQATDKLRHESICDYMTEEKNTGRYTYANFIQIWNNAFTFLEEVKNNSC